MRRLTDQPRSISLNDQLHDAIRPSHANEHAQRDQRNVQPVGDLLERAALHPGLVVVDPQPAGERDGDGGEADAACEGQEVVEDWDGFGEDELLGVSGWTWPRVKGWWKGCAYRDTSQTERQPQPRSPVHKRVLLQVMRIAQKAHEAVLSRDVEVQASRDHETNETDAVRDHLDRLPRGAEGRRSDPAAAPSVDHQGERQVSGVHNPHADEQTLAVVAWVPHLAYHGQEGAGAGRGDEDGAAGYHAGGEGRVCYGVVAELEVACLGR